MVRLNSTLILRQARDSNAAKYKMPNFHFHCKIMYSEATDHIHKFSSVFEPGLLTELETRSMLMNVSGGETMLNPGQTIRAVPLVVSGTFKVSRINDEGQELLLYYVKEGESCAMSFTCCMMAHVVDQS